MAGTGENQALIRRGVYSAQAPFLDANQQGKCCRRLWIGLALGSFITAIGLFIAGGVSDAEEEGGGLVFTSGHRKGALMAEGALCAVLGLLLCCCIDNKPSESNENENTAHDPWDPRLLGHLT